MSALIGNPLLLTSAPAADDDSYKIEKSLRFNSADSASLQRTPRVIGNRRTFTISYWVKKCRNDAYGEHFAQKSGTPWSTFQFGTGNNYQLNWGAGQNNGYIQTTAVFRDLSAWYHICVVWDTTNKVETERARIYINGKRQAVTNQGGWPTQGEEMPTGGWNDDAGTQYVGGGGPDGNSDYLSDIHHIDGLALSPAAFGSFDSTGVWNPKAFARPTPNDGTTWSDSVSGTHNSSNDKTLAFDGNLGTRCTPGDGQTMTFTPSSTITASSQIRCYIFHKGDSNWAVNGINQTGETNNAEQWFTLSERTIETLTWSRTNSNNQTKIHAIEVDGVILVDGQTDPATRTNPNNDTTWSAGTESGQALTNGGGGSQGWDKHMDGDPGTPTMHTSSSATHYTYTNKLPAGNYRIFAALSSTGATTHILTGDDDTEYTFGSSGTDGIVNTGAQNWSTVVNIPQKVKKVTLIDPSNGNGTSLRVIEVDGHVLVDETVDNSFHLKFNDSSLNRYLGKDTLNGKIADATGGLPFYNTSDDYGDVKGSGYAADSSAGTTDGAGLILAIPGDVLTDEHDHINTGSSAKTATSTNGNVAVSTDQSRLYGSSIFFDGSDDYIVYSKSG